MIVIAPPRLDTFRGRRVTTAHMVSTLHGAEGTTELLTFAESIGMRPEWIQHRGEPREHFDLIGRDRCNQAIAAGATVDRTALGLALIEKRRAATARAIRTVRTPWSST